MKAALIASVALGATLLSSPQARAQDAAKGEKVFQVCRACHQIGPDAKNAVGPVLNGIIGRKAGTYPGYSYSEANKTSGITWTEEEFTKYIKNPRGVVPGTKMIFVGIKDEDKIKDLIAFLKTYDESGKKVTP
jgi:cytochrome c